MTGLHTQLRFWNASSWLKQFWSSKVFNCLSENNTGVTAEHWIPALCFWNTNPRISPIKTEQCMKPEKLATHTSRFLQKYNTHTHTHTPLCNTQLFQYFPEAKDGKRRKNPCQILHLPAKIRGRILSIAFMYPCKRSPHLSR